MIRQSALVNRIYVFLYLFKDASRRKQIDQSVVVLINFTAVYTKFWEQEFLKKAGTIVIQGS